MANFSITTQSLAPTAAMSKLTGTLDGDAFEVLEEEFSKLLQSGVKALVLEASGLENLTSAALGAFIDMKRVLGERGGVLTLALLRPGNEGLLEMLDLKNALPLAGSLEEARKIITAVR